MPVLEERTPSLFWGIVLKSDKRYEQTVEETFHISKACLEPTQNNDKVSTVYLEQESEEFILCNLREKNLNETLDLNFSKSEKICFRVEGGGTVHLTGYLVPDEDLMGSIDEYESGEEMDEDLEENNEETAPKLIEKRKLQNGDSLKLNKTTPLDNLLAENKKAKKDDSSKKAGEKLTNEIKQAEAMKKILEKKKGKEESEEDSSDDDSEDMDDSEVEEGSSFFSTEAKDEDESEEDGEEEEDSGNEGNDSGEELDGEEESEESSDDDSEEDTPKQKVSKHNGIDNKETPKLNSKQQKKDTPQPLKKEKNIATPQPVTPGKGQATPVQKKAKENKQSNAALTTNQNTPSNSKGGKTPGKANQSIGPQTPKNEAKSISKDKEKTQTPNQKTPKKQLKGGLMVEDLKIGNGPEAKPGKMVGMYYEGRLKSNNKQFDAQKEGKPFRFRLGKGEVIKGWDVGVDGMKVGGKRRLTVPPNMGYGAQGAPPDIPPNSTLVFDVECKMAN